MVAELNARAIAAINFYQTGSINPFWWFARFNKMTETKSYG